MGFNFVAYVDKSLSKEAYIHTYTGFVHPTLNEKAWPEVDVDEVISLNNGRKPYRPRVVRRRETSEATKQKRFFTFKCGV